MVTGARGFWEKREGQMTEHKCEKVRVVGSNVSQAYFDDKLVPPPARREVLKRTFDTWGKDAQQNISRLRVGIVGLGSVGCIVAEAIARIGVSKITLIDYDVVKRHNLDRLLYATERGHRKAQGRSCREENPKPRDDQRHSDNFAAHVNS